MCIAYFALGDTNWPLFIAANRDERHDRPALAAAPWATHPDIIAGIDLSAGGTWLGITRHGRFGLLTNYREPGVQVAGAPSRGELVSQWLTGSAGLDTHASAVAERAAQYNGFNLIIGDLTAAYYVSNRHEPIQAKKIPAGPHVVSNHLLDTPWPKTQRLLEAFETYTPDTNEAALQQAFAILKNTDKAPDTALPSTGVGLEMERLLSSPFIISPAYGTRCSTIIAVHASGQALLSETSYNAEGNIVQRHDWPFAIQCTPGMLPAGNFQSSSSSA